MTTSEEEFTHWELTTPAGVTVEKENSPSGPLIRDGVVYFITDGKVTAFYSMRNVIGVGRITEEDYNTFKAEAAAPEVDSDEEDQYDDNERYRLNLQEYISGGN